MICYRWDAQYGFYDKPKDPLCGTPKKNALHVTRPPLTTHNDHVSIDLVGFLVDFDAGKSFTHPNPDAFFIQSFIVEQCFESLLSGELFKILYNLLK